MRKENNPLIESQNLCLTNRVHILQLSQLMTQKCTPMDLEVNKICQLFFACFRRRSYDFMCIQIKLFQTSKPVFGLSAIRDQIPTCVQSNVNSNRNQLANLSQLFVLSFSFAHFEADLQVGLDSIGNFLHSHRKS